MKFNSYSYQVRRAFIDLLPEHEPYMSGPINGVLEIVVPHPKIETGLRVTTADDEISIGFREWHTHVDLLADGSEKDMITAAVELVRDILHGHIRLVVSYRNGRFQDAWPTDDEENELRGVWPEERLEFGTWQQLSE